MKFMNGNKYKSGGSIILLPHDAIRPNPHQPRKTFDFDELQGLAASIKNNGIIQPLVVRRLTNDEYELISGERRLRAAKMVGLTTVPCVLMSADESESALYAIIENLQRDNLTYFEEAQAIEKLSSVFHMTQEEISGRLGKSQSCLSNKLRLLKLGTDVRNVIIENSLSERHARALLKLKTDRERLDALDYILAKNLNVNETDKYIDSLISPTPSRSQPKINKLKDIKIFVNTINHAVDTMRNAGIKADLRKHETPEYYEYVVQIPKLTSSPVNIVDYPGNAV